MTLLGDSVTAGLAAVRIVGKTGSYKADNPVESKAVLAYLQGGSRPPSLATAMGRHLVALEDARRAGYAPPTTTPPPTAPPPVPSPLGGDLPKRQDAPMGSQREYTTYDALQSAILAAAPGSRVKLTDPIDCGGRDLVIRCVGNPGAPVLVDLNAPVRNGRILISRAAYANVWIADADGSPGDALKLTDGSHHIDIDGHGGYLRGCAGEAFLQTDPTCHDWQVWNFRCRANGSSLNFDQDAYIAAARGSYPASGDSPCVIGNFDMEPWAYGFQAYPDARGLIATGLGISGTRSVSDPRGGAVFGTDGSAGKATQDVLLVASWIRGARQWGAHIEKTAARIKLASVFGWDNLPGDWAPDSAITLEHCGHSDGGIVHPDHFKWTSPYGIDGIARDPVAPKAGPYA